MRISKCIIITFFLLLGYPTVVFAQFKLYHELGVIAGPVFFKSDYGQRYDFQTNVENSGLGVGIVHYLNFDYTEFHDNEFTSYLRDHFKIRSELSYNYTTFQHYGKYIQGSETSEDAMQLRQMRGATKVLNLGAGGEFSLFKTIHEFEATDGSWGPFAGLGLQISYYDPIVYSELGPLDQPGVLFPKFEGGVSNKSGYVWSAVMNVGTRYKIDVMSDIIIDLRGQYYFSDWVEGLYPDPDRNPGNKYNDWNIWFCIGYIHYIDRYL